jgi:hypothetical protein
MSTRMSSGPIITRDRGDDRANVSLTLGFGHAKAPFRLARQQDLSKLLLQIDSQSDAHGTLFSAWIALE